MQELNGSLEMKRRRIRNALWGFSSEMLFPCPPTGFTTWKTSNSPLTVAFKAMFHRLLSGTRSAASPLLRREKGL